MVRPGIEVTHSVDSGLYEDFSIGNATTAKLTLTLYTEQIPQSATIKRYVRLRNGEQVSEWIPKGVFFTNRLRQPVSRVTLKVDSETTVTAGDDTGLELSADCPYATQIMADTILASVKGMEYKMYVASDANIDPAAELGDGMSACGLYSVIAGNVLK